MGRGDKTPARDCRPGYPHGCEAPQDDGKKVGRSEQRPYEFAEVNGGGENDGIWGRRGKSIKINKLKWHFFHLFWLDPFTSGGGCGRLGMLCCSVVALDRSI
jgi:hypothetical protein